MQFSSFKAMVLFAMLFALPWAAFGQGHFQRGYVITHQSDTLRGEVRDQNSRNKTLQCVFRNDTGSEVMTFGPEDIAGYGIGDTEVYISQRIMARDSSEYQPRFLQLFFDGRVRLFTFSDQDGDRYFVEKDGGLYELKNSHAFTRYDTNHHRKLMRREYVGMLIWLFSDGVENDSGLTEIIHNTLLQPLSLANTASAYHALVCDEGEECEVLIHKPSYRIRFTPFVHVGNNYFSHNYRDSEAVRTSMISSFHPQVGLRLDIYVPSLTDFGRLFFVASYERFSGELYRQYKASKVYEMSVHAFADYSVFATSIGLSFPLKNILYPSDVYFGFRNAFLFNAQVYSFDKHINDFANINPENHLQGSAFGRLSPGLVGGYRYMWSFSSKTAMTLGLEVSFVGAKFNDETRYNISSGFQVGFMFN